MRVFFALIWLLLATVSVRADLSADVVFLGEVHDNPHHHARQAELVGAISPKALVFEMLTPAQADLVTPDLRSDANDLASALKWGASGWPDFAMYYPIFAAAPNARIYGAAVPRETARSVMTLGLVEAFGERAGLFGLHTPLPAEQSDKRKALQMRAHCNAMPEEMLPMMVDIQRMRDAALARAALDALSHTGGPVVVITGNGHARKDWGAPAALAFAAPRVSIASLGQGEIGNGPPSGAFDQIEMTSAALRDDPCEKLRKAHGD